MFRSPPPSFRFLPKKTKAVTARSEKERERAIVSERARGDRERNRVCVCGKRGTPKLRGLEKERVKC